MTTEPTRDRLPKDDLFSSSTSGLRRRYLRAVLLFARIVAMVLFWDLLLPRLGLRWLARRNRRARYQRAARRFRRLATRLGGVWIKVGQFLSARVDVLPEAITAELSGLQDEVSPEPFAALKAVIEQEVGLASFVWLDDTPLASASLGQVHRARLPDGGNVVVKVQRPQIEARVRVDLAALRRVIGWLKSYRPIARRADLDALYQEFSSVLWQELDYHAEAENARRFGRMFADDPGVRIPQVVDELSSGHVLTLEDVYFIKVTDYQAVEAAGVDRGQVAQRLFETYLHQIFMQGFFHADPHPGNLFVEPLDDQGAWRLVFVDFGMVGRLPETLRAGLLELAIAVGTRDLDRMFKAYQSLGVLLPSADISRLREAEAAVFERFWGKSMRELTSIEPRDMREFAHEFRDLLYEMPFQVPSDLIYLGRCVAILSGMCTGLNPDFNLFAALAPFAQEVLAQESGVGLDWLLEWLLEQGKALGSLPGHLDDVLQKAGRGELTVNVRAAPDLRQRLDRLSSAVDHLTGALLFAALLLAGVYLWVQGFAWQGYSALALGLLALVVASRRRVR